MRRKLTLKSRQETLNCDLRIAGRALPAVARLVRVALDRHFSSWFCCLRVDLHPGQIPALVHQPARLYFADGRFGCGIVTWGSSARRGGTRLYVQGYGRILSPAQGGRFFPI